MGSTTSLCAVQYWSRVTCYALPMRCLVLSLGMLIPDARKRSPRGAGIESTARLRNQMKKEEENLHDLYHEFFSCAFDFGA